MDAASEQLQVAARNLGVALSGRAVEDLQRYAKELLLWRTRLNLTGAATTVDLVNPHFLDALLFLGTVKIPQAAAIVDIGTGAGFPGVPLLIVRPDIRMVLVEATQKKVAFLEHVQTVLGLDEIRIEWGRAETLAHRRDLREAFDIAVTRATARLAAAAELCLPFVKIRGAAVCLKGPRAAVELDSAIGLIEMLGARVESTAQQRLPTTQLMRTIVVMRKERATPTDYPRAAGALGRPPRAHKGTGGSVAE